MVKDLISSLHDTFKDTVRSARGAKLSAANEAELWSGRVWTGAQAAKIGLVDGTGTVQSVMRSKYGDQVAVPSAYRLYVSLLQSWGLIWEAGFL